MMNAVENRRIAREMPEKRPYGVRLCVKLQHQAALGPLDTVTICTESGETIRFRGSESAPWEGGYRGAFEMDAFATPTAAEIAGKRLTVAILWAAISNQAALQLVYRTQQPAYVFERSRSSGFSGRGYGTTGRELSDVVAVVHDTYEQIESPDPRHILSMELCAGARLEVSERASFVSLVSAFEPLAAPGKQAPKVVSFIKDTLDRLKADSSISPDDRQSLSSRIGQLKDESIGQGIRNFVAETLPRQLDAPALVMTAYGLRSQLVHSGQLLDPDVDLAGMTSSLEALLREIYRVLLERQAKA